MTGFLPACLLVSGLLLGQTDAQAIARAIEQLGDDRFPVREEATQFLWQAGIAAEPALQAALQSNDIEVRQRAASVLDRFQVGLYPGVSPIAAGLVGEFRSGNASKKRQAITKLLELGETQIPERLIHSETNESLRASLLALLRSVSERKIADLLITGDIEQAKQILERQGGPQTPRRLATLHFLQGDLDTAIAAWAERQRKQPTDINRAILAELYRAAEQIEKAEALSPEVLSPKLSATRAIHKNQWADAARHWDEKLEKVQPEYLEGLGFSAICHRLAGQQEQYEKRIAELLELADREPTWRWHIYEILLLNERTDEAIERFKTFRPSTALELLCVRLQFKEAFAFIDLNRDTKLDLAWFNRLPKGAEVGGDIAQRNQQYLVALEAAFFLVQLGEREQALQIFALLRNDVLPETTDESARKWQETELCRIQLRAGLADAAFTDAGHFIKDREIPERLFNVLFPQHAVSARSWWQWLTRRFPGASGPEKLSMLRSVLTTWTGKTPHSGEELMEMASSSFDTDTAPVISQRLRMLIDAYLAHHQKQQAIDFLEARLSRGANTGVSYQLSQLYFQTGQYDKAAAEFGRIASSSPASRYMQGTCEIQAGRTTEGRKQQHIALLMASEDTARVALWQTVRSLGLPANELSDLTDTLRRTSPPAIHMIAGEIGDSLEHGRPAQAADLWQWRMIELHHVNFSLPADSLYVTLPLAQHRARARNHLATGDREAFARELALAQQLAPDYWELVEEFVPKLNQLGWTKEADALYENSHRRLQAILHDYPRSPRYHNILAWNAAIARRNLPEALQSAQKAVELEPQRANHYDTLAELYQLQGEHDKALAALRRASELEPQTSLFTEKLKKWQAQSPPAN